MIQRSNLDIKTDVVPKKKCDKYLEDKNAKEYMLNGKILNVLSNMLKKDVSKNNANIQEGIRKLKNRRIEILKSELGNEISDDIYQKYVDDVKFFDESLEKTKNDMKKEQIINDAKKNNDMESIVSNIKIKLQKKQYVLNAVGKMEYNKYPNLYDKLNSLNLKQDYENILIERFKSLNDDVKKVYNIYTNQLDFIDTNYNDTAHFNLLDKGIRFNENLDYNNILGSGNTFFHESAHMIDWLAGKNGITITQLNKLTSEAQADYNNALSKIMVNKKCTWEEAQKILKRELMIARNEANCVSDVFGGLSENKVIGIWGHPLEYWKNNDKSVIGMEAFAEITADLACSISNYNFTKKYMSRTVSMYHKIIKSILGKE